MAGKVLLLVMDLNPDEAVAAGWLRADSAAGAHAGTDVAVQFAPGGLDYRAGPVHARPHRGEGDCA